jgi:hypothetical protein
MTPAKMEKLSKIVELMVFVVMNGMLEKSMLVDHHSMICTPMDLRSSLKALQDTEQPVEIISYHTQLDDGRSESLSWDRSEELYQHFLAGLFPTDDSQFESVPTVPPNALSSLRFTRILDHTKHVLLSSSANVQFPPPYLLERLRAKEWLEATAQAAVSQHIGHSSLIILESNIYSITAPSVIRG